MHRSFYIATQSQRVDTAATNALEIELWRAL